MRAMNNQIIVRLRSPEGQNRLSVMSGDTFGQFMLQVSKKLNYPLKDLIFRTQDNRSMAFQQGKKIYDIPYFKDGTIIKVESKQPKPNKKQSHGVGVSQVQSITSKCNHPPGGKCLNCLGGPKKQEQAKSDKPKCNHGPGGKCLNCTQVDDKNTTTRNKWLCQHGPNAKCVHCLDMQFISDAAHISFDHYLEQKKLKCKGVHPSDVKCNNCLPPSQIRYEVDRNCKKHEPYPKAMCNKCIPPSVVIKRQQYRHVDYVEFMNIDQISNFIKYWVQKKHMTEQRVGFLYGYYAEDPHYKGGIRVIVQAIYEPKQKGTYSNFQILDSPAEISKVDHLAASLTLERIGWIYTQNSHDTVMTETQTRMAARYQQQYNVPHSSGYPISNFITVILRNDEKNHGDVKPQVYMISDQGQALEKYNLFVESESRKMMKMKIPQSPKEALPSFIVGGKNATQFEPQFLLVKIGHGSSKSNKFAILKKSKFPAKNQVGATAKDFKEYLQQNKKKSSHIKYGDFNFLIYLADVLDIETAVSIAECVEREIPIAQAIDELIEHKADL